MMRDGKGYALLNNTFVTVGAEFEKMKVETVTKQAVVLKTIYGDKKIIILEGLQSKLEEVQQMLEEGNSK